jgi:signal transduction histidine kinase
MLRSLRSRLIFSHILPLVIIIPLMNLALVYLLETRFLVPQLTQELLDNARILTRAIEVQPGRTEEFTLIVSRVELDPTMRLVYLAPDGTLLHSNDPDYLRFLGQKLEINGLARARSGQEVVLTNYSFFRSRQDFAQVLFPVTNAQDQVIGVLWVTYFAYWVNDLFGQLRYLSIAVISGALLIGILLGSILAVNISKPVGQVTEAIYSLARGEQKERLRERGPGEMRALVRAVNYLVERLNTLETSRRQLLANLVHELGRPLGALRSAIQALGKGAGSDPELLSDLTTGMDEEAARLQRVVEDLAHLHDQVLGTLELKRETVALGEWLPTVLVPWAEAAVEKGLEWRAEIPADLPEAQIDTLRFGQVVGNLTSNALRYTPSGGSICISAGTLGQQVWIKVSDTGPGIPLEEQEAVFLPLYRGDQGRRRIKQGMGLGLSIARDLIQAHGGTIELESSPGAGSHFTIWLPIDPS